MKKTTFTLLLSLSCCWLAAQCPTEIGFFSQAQVDAFPVNYPGCKDIPGHVHIYVDDIQSLEPLQGITSIGGELFIDLAGLFPNVLLQNLHGLDSLRSIGGRLGILFTSLVNLEGLNNLKHVGGDIGILYNPSLVNLEGLNNLKHVGGDIIIAENHALISLEGLENLDTLPGSVFIGHFSPVPGQDPQRGNNALPNLKGLDNLRHIGGDLNILGGALHNMSGLENLRSIGGSMIVKGQDSLASFSGLDSLQSIDSTFEFSDNYSNTSFAGLGSLRTIGKDLYIEANDSLVALTGLENISTIGGMLYIWYNPLLSLCAVESICKYLEYAPDTSYYIDSNAPGCWLDEVFNACATPAKEVKSGAPSLTYFPNPAGDFLQIQVNDPDQWEINLFDLRGRLLYRQSVSGSQIIEVKDWPSGIYALRAVSGARVFSGKIVKQ